MNASLVIRRGLIGLLSACAVVILATAGFAAAVDAGLFRGTLLRLVAARLGRSVEVQGALKTELFSKNPRVTAERVLIGNPPWTPAGRTAAIGELILVFQMPGLHRHFGIESLSMKSATLTLTRDAAGHANWQWANPDRGHSDKKMAIVRSLFMPAAHVVLDDARRHLAFEGTVSAAAVAGEGPQPERIEGTGQLNGRAASFEITGDPLIEASHIKPYGFTFAERSSGSRLEGRGSLPRPFDFYSVEASFDAAGADLKDLFFLTGVTLVNTGTYRLSGKFEREGLQFKFTELKVSSGESDVLGSVSIDSSNARSRLDVQLDSQVLHMADLGAKAAGRAAAPDAAPLLLSNTALKPASLRKSEATISFRARRLDVGKISLHGIAARASIDHGVLTVSSFSGELLNGKIQARGKLDANSDPPAADMDIKIADLALDQIHRKDAGPSPIEGLLQARIAVTGRGASVHQIAATANGTITVVVPRGAVRDSFAELTGIDLRGLGLLLAKDKRETELRCAAGILKDREGTLSVQSFLADTVPVLITGEGQIHLDSEALDLAIRGQPKSLRLFRFHSPVLVRGTLAHPSIDIQARKLEIVDPAKASDADCAALIASVDTENAKLHPLAAEH